MYEYTTTDIYFQSIDEYKIVHTFFFGILPIKKGMECIRVMQRHPQGP